MNLNDLVDTPRGVIMMGKQEKPGVSQNATKIISMVPLFLVMVVFIGGLAIAIDTTAGERERLSLVALLSNPVPPSGIVIGKWLAAVVFAQLSFALTLVGTLAVISSWPIEELGLRLASSGRSATLTHHPRVSGMLSVIPPQPQPPLTSGIIGSQEKQAGLG
jgi:sodium transport system permease protein